MSMYAAGYRGLGNEWNTIMAPEQPITLTAPGGTVKPYATEASREANRQRQANIAALRASGAIAEPLLPSVLTVEPEQPGQRVGQRFSLQSIPWWGWAIVGVVAWQVFGGRR